MKNLKTLGIICSISSLSIVFSLILDMPLALQFILLIIGLVTGVIGMFGLIKLLFGK